MSSKVEPGKIIEINVEQEAGLDFNKRRIPMFEDFVVDGATFKDIRGLTSRKERTRITEMLARRVHKIPPEFRCVPKVLRDNVDNPSVLFNLTSETGLSDAEIQTWIKDPELNPVDETIPDYEEVSFGIYDGQDLVGAFMLYEIRILTNTEQRIRVSSMPFPAFGPNGESFWGPRKMSIKRIEFIVNITKHFLSLTGTTLRNGKNLRFVEFRMEKRGVANAAKDEDMVESRGGKTTLLVEDFTGVTRREGTFNGGAFIFWEQEVVSPVIGSDGRGR